MTQSLLIMRNLRMLISKMRGRNQKAKKIKLKMEKVKKAKKRKKMMMLNPNQMLTGLKSILK